MAESERPARNVLYIFETQKLKIIILIWLHDNAYDYYTVVMFKLFKCK